MAERPKAPACLAGRGCKAPSWVRIPPFPLSAVFPGPTLVAALLTDIVTAFDGLVRLSTARPRPNSGFQASTARLGPFLGCVVGGCGILALEVLGTCGVFLIGGAAVLRALPSPGVGGSLVGQSAPCAPEPCLAYGGLELHISNINRNAGRGTPFGSPDPALHLLKLDATFVNQTGDHEINAVGVTVIDGSGNHRVAHFGTGCAFGTVIRLTPRTTFAPIPLCFYVKGASSDPITLQWLLTETGAPPELRVRLP